MLKRKLAGVVVPAMLAVVTVTGAARADPLGDACANYAALAVRQNGLNLAVQCRLSGPRWSNDFNGHRAWCVATGAAHAASEIAARETALAACPRDKQLTSSQFQNANQKSTQFNNMLSSVLKSIHEAQQGIIKNRR